MELEAVYQQRLNDNILWALDNIKDITHQYAKYHKLRKLLDEQIMKLQKINLSQQKLQRNEVIAKNYIDVNLSTIEKQQQDLTTINDAIENRGLDTQTITYFTKELGLFKTDLQQFLLSLEQQKSTQKYEILTQKLQKLCVLKQNTPIEAQRQQFCDIFAYAQQVIYENAGVFIKSILGQINCVEDFQGASQIIIKIQPILQCIQLDSYNKQYIDRLFGQLLSKIYTKRDLRSIERGINNYINQFRDYLAYCQALKKGKFKFMITGSILNFILSNGKENIKDMFKQDIKPFLLNKTELLTTGPGISEFVDISANKQQWDDHSTTTWAGRVYMQLQSKFYDDIQTIAQFASKLYCGNNFKVSDWYIQLLQQQCQISNALYGKLTYNNLLYCTVQSHSGQYVSRMEQIIVQLAQSVDYLPEYKEQVLKILLFNTQLCEQQINSKYYDRIVQEIKTQITHQCGKTGDCE